MVLDQRKSVLPLREQTITHRHIRRLELQKVHKTVHSPNPNLVLGIVGGLIRQSGIVLLVKLYELCHFGSLLLTNPENDHIRNVGFAMKWLKIDALCQRSANVNSK